jgi:group I intron endonuclease
MTGIYKIQSPTGKVYIGQSIDIERRFRQYKYGLKNCHQLKLKASIQKHGIAKHIFNVEYILPGDVSTDVLNSYEQFYIDQYRVAGFILLNIKEAGSNGLMAQETKDKISNALKGVPKKRIGFKLSDEHVQAIRKANKGRKMPPRSEQWRDRQRAAMKGKPSQMKGKKHTEESLIKMSNSHKGKKLSPESIIKREEKRKINRKKAFWSEESRRKMSERMKGATPWNKKA